MSIRSEVHNAITTSDSGMMPLTREGFETPNYKNRTCSCSILVNNWNPWCNYVQLYPKQFAVARLLIRYGMLPMRIEVRTYPISLPHHDTFVSGWSVFAIDCASSLVLACMTGTHQWPCSQSFSLKSICEDPHFIFNHLDGTNSRALHVRKFVEDFQL